MWDRLIRTTNQVIVWHIPLLLVTNDYQDIPLLAVRNKPLIKETNSLLFRRRYKSSTPPLSILNVFMIIILKLDSSYGSNHHYFNFVGSGIFLTTFQLWLSFTIYQSDDKRSLFNNVGNCCIDAGTTQCWVCCVTLASISGSTFIFLAPQ